MSSRGPWLSVALVGIGLVIGIGCDRAAPSGGAAAPKAAKPSTAPATQPASGDLSAIQRMVADSGSGADASSVLAKLPPGHPPVPGLSPPSAQTPNMPAGHPPLNAPTSTSSAAQMTEPGVPLLWDAPLDWKPARPASTFRVAQYEIPAVEGETPGEVAVFHFTGSGGSVEDNVARWVSQFSDAGGKAIDPAAVKRETFEANGLKVHFVEVSGYMMVGKSMGGTGERSPGEYRLLGGIVEMPDGNWFFKGTGPDKTMATAREAFVRLLASVHGGEASAESP
jgi:hypothetical protein